jgi:hypothetical protein
LHHPRDGSLLDQLGPRTGRIQHCVDVIPGFARRQRDEGDAYFRRNPCDEELLPSGLLHGGDEVSVVPRVDLAWPMRDRRVGKPFCNDWHDRAIRPISCTGRDDRRELVDLRDRDERLHVVDEVRGALGLHTIRESGLVVDEEHRRIACSESVVRHVCSPSSVDEIAVTVTAP